MLLVTSARPRSLASLGPALATLLLAVGCYNPNIGEKFVCNKDYEPNAGQCPEGFHCENNLCLKGPPRDGGAGGSTDAPADSPPDAPIEAAPDVPPMCYVPVPNCSADTTQGCDPACQAGCKGCLDKCSVSSRSALTCNPPTANTRLRQLLETCNPAFAGTDKQTDDCAPGLVCMTDGCGMRCYRFCKTDNDCGPMTPCSKTVGPGAKVCDVPFASCDPSKGGKDDGCGTPSDNLACYASVSQMDRTYCDCPTGAGGINTGCTMSTDCNPSLVCAGSVGATQCRQACDLTKPICQSGVCTPLNGSTKLGYCN
jgi:hypothetical protein